MDDQINGGQTVEISGSSSYCFCSSLLPLVPLLAGDIEYAVTTLYLRDQWCFMEASISKWQIKQVCVCEGCYMGGNYSSNTRRNCKYMGIMHT